MLCGRRSQVCFGASNSIITTSTGGWRNAGQTPSRPHGRHRPVPGFPRAAAFSGALFAVLYMTSLILLRMSVPADPRDPGEWLEDALHRSHVRLALNLVPFSGIAFLWFMAVLRIRLGLIEDRFVTTVFLGSGLLFLAMLFTAVANARVIANLECGSAGYTGE